MLTKRREREKERDRYSTLVCKQHRREYSCEVQSAARTRVACRFSNKNQRPIGDLHIRRISVPTNWHVCGKPTNTELVSSRAQPHKYVCICISQPQDIEAWITRPNSKDVAATGCGRRSNRSLLDGRHFPLIPLIQLDNWIELNEYSYYHLLLVVHNYVHNYIDYVPKFTRKIVTFLNDELIITKLS